MNLQSLVINEDKIKWLLKGYFAFVLLELFLLGSGQIIKYQSLTLRMVNFILLNAFCFMLFRKERIRPVYLKTVYVYIALLIFSSIIGFLNGATMTSVFNDVKPLLFFIYLIPFSFLIKTPNDIERVVRLLKISAIILSVLYFLYLILYLFYPVVMFALFPLEKIGEVFFRGNGPYLFYKGFFFIMISIFLFNKQSIRDRMIVISLLFAIFLSLTRGLYFALIASFIITGLIQLSFKMRITLRKLLLIVSVFILLSLFLPYYISLIGDKSGSDSIRIALIENVNAAITPLSLIFGHGFGTFAGVNRPHLEISYYEILHKQGLIGLVLWILPLIYCFNKMVVDLTNILNKRFFLAVLSVYLISLTNPFINNPLGLSIIVIAIISMDIQNNKNELHQIEFNDTSLSNLVIK